jgi:hypothetical protein
MGMKGAALFTQVVGAASTEQSSVAITTFSTIHCSRPANGPMTRTFRTDPA